MLVQSLPDIELVAQVATGEEAVRACTAIQPDIAVMDLSMPGIGGIEATRRITERTPHVRVLVLSMLEDDASLFAAMRAGASGYVVKGAGQAEIVRAVSAVAGGEVIFGPAVARRVVAYLSRGSGRPSPAFPELTPRETQVLEQLARGDSNRTIATHLDISEKTVRNQVSLILTKLQAADRAEAIARARDAGLGTP
jgi:DNA-binding NarL/FixJ family response regulator